MRAHQWDSAFHRPQRTGNSQSTGGAVLLPLSGVADGAETESWTQTEWYGCAQVVSGFEVHGRMADGCVHGTTQERTAPPQHICCGGSSWKVQWAPHATLFRTLLYKMVCLKSFLKSSWPAFWGYPESLFTAHPPPAHYPSPPGSSVLGYYRVAHSKGVNLVEGPGGSTSQQRGKTVSRAVWPHFLCCRIRAPHLMPTRRPGPGLVWTKLKEVGAQA